MIAPRRPLARRYAVVRMGVSADSVLRLLDRRAARVFGDRVRVSVSGLSLVRGWIDFAMVRRLEAAPA